MALSARALTCHQHLLSLPCGARPCQLCCHQHWPHHQTPEPCCDGGTCQECLCHPYWKQPPWYWQKNTFHQWVWQWLQKYSVEQAGVVWLGCGGVTQLSLKCSRECWEAGIAEEEEGCSQQHGRGLSHRNLLACGLGLLNLVKAIEVATK